MSHLDEVGLRSEADIIRAVVRAGIDLDTADGRELWELAAACNLDLYETVWDRDIRRKRPDADPDYWQTDAGQERLERAQAASERRRKRRAGK